MKKRFSKLILFAAIISCACFSTNLSADKVTLDGAIDAGQTGVTGVSKVSSAASKIMALKENADDIRKACDKIYDGVKNQSKFSKFLGNLGIGLKLGDIALNAAQTVQADNKADFVKNFEECTSASLSTIIGLVSDLGANAAYAASAGTAVTGLGGIGFLVLGVALDFGASYVWDALYAAMLKDQISKLGAYIWDLLHPPEGNSPVQPIQSSILSGSTRIKNSTIENINTKVINESKDESKINSGILLRRSEVEDSNITNINDNVLNKATNKSIINSGIDADGATIKKSSILNSISNSENTATNKSEVNAGVKLKDAKIGNSQVLNIGKNINNSGNNKSKINSGIDLGEND